MHERHGVGALVRVLAVSGSLQDGSTNTALTQLAASRAPDGVDVEVFEALGTIPPFNPGLTDEPREISSWRSLVRRADGVLFATPEYAFGLPGVLKNALDWLVGGGELDGKVTVVLSAAPSGERGQHARADLERTLRAQGAIVVLSRTIAVPRAARDEPGRDARVLAAIDEALAALRSAHAPQSNSPD